MAAKFDVERALETFGANDVSLDETLRVEREVDLGVLVPAWKAAAIATIEQILGPIASSTSLDLLATAQVRAGAPERATETRLRALERTPRWDSFEAARILFAVAEDLLRLGLASAAADVATQVLAYDPVSPPARALLASQGREAPVIDLAPISDQELVRLLLSDDFAVTLGDHFARPRRFALTCLRRGEAGLEHGDPIARIYVEHANALEDALGRSGNASSTAWAMPKKILARHAGDPTASWTFLD